MAEVNPRDNSFLYVLFTVLLVLVLFEKSSVRNDLAEKLTQKTSLKNFSPDKEFTDIPVSEDIPLVEDELYIAELEEEDSLGPDREEPQEQNNIALYFLKFYGKGNKSHSRLVRVERKAAGDVNAVLEQLIAGPTAAEKKEGVLSAIPNSITFDRNFKIKDRVLHISFSGKIEYGAGPDLMLDRLDQIIYTLLELDEIDGIKLYIDGKRVSSIGGDGINLPNILTRRDRKVMTL